MTRPIIKILIYLLQILYKFYTRFEYRQKCVLSRYLVMVVSCENNIDWYNDRIGELFEVNCSFAINDDSLYQVLFGNNCGDHIKKSDCKIIKEFCLPCKQ